MRTFDIILVLLVMIAGAAAADSPVSRISNYPLVAQGAPMYSRCDVARGSRQHRLDFSQFSSLRPTASLHRHDGR